MAKIDDAIAELEAKIAAARKQLHDVKTGNESLAKRTSSIRIPKRSKELDVKIKADGTLDIWNIKSPRDVDPWWNDFSRLWPRIRDFCGSTQRSPKRVVLTETPRPVYADDGDIVHRLVLNLDTGDIDAGHYISTGECAINAPRGSLGPVTKIPLGYALLTCKHTDYRHWFEIAAQLPPGSLNRMRGALTD